MEERVVLVKTVGKTLRAEYQRVAPVGNAALEIENLFLFFTPGGIEENSYSTEKHSQLFLLLRGCLRVARVCVCPTTAGVKKFLASL